MHCSVKKLRAGIRLAEQDAAAWRQRVDEAYLVARDWSSKIYDKSDIRRCSEAWAAHDRADQKLSRFQEAIRLLNEMLEDELLRTSAGDSNFPWPDIQEVGMFVYDVLTLAFAVFCWVLVCLLGLNTSTSPDSPREQTPQTPPRHATPPPKYEQPAPAFQPNPQDAIVAWRTKVEMMSADYASLESFPSPPTTVRCTNAKCHAEQHRALPVCECNVRAAFWRVPGLDPMEERRTWHPDRFSACEADKRERFKAMAREMFVVVDEMFRLS
ncbi:hypothetical protein CLAFUW4_08624 [Fulvia fulva]|uniref:Uncharacterized protein n=1 Tax=Passalora fulva TaxID=5499 RepID=A0A9Q8LDS0_PASFU|nr:uncharacterized protein CLAFUR5_08725 [Fulvia fulva]KAK4629963.1 hypothetical protein CLAFUR0_08622 [Fulvia fulva]UJO15520.1 hypothetical protein CLAFUR5_08725 [Fulvia fulva]WPV13079.1 hypothetical protein CLAFUW4_08624 [Fulvia fulva]